MTAHRTFKIDVHNESVISGETTDDAELLLVRGDKALDSDWWTICFYRSGQPCAIRQTYRQTHAGAMDFIISKLGGL